MNNIIHNKQLGRIIQYDDEWTQITVGDQRFYKKKDIYYPSVTFILSSTYPKGKFFNNWLKEKGEEADIIVAESAEKGTNVHQAIEKILKGYELKWIDENGYLNYNEEEWLMILRFAEFWNTHKPTLIKSEFHVFSNVNTYAGTIDLIIELNGEKWIIDIKTSNAVHFIYDLQNAAYCEAWNELFDDNIKNYGVLWLNAKTRKPSKDKIQGKGWQLVLPQYSHEENMKIFKHTHEIWKVEHPNPQPIINNYPNSIKLNIEDIAI